MSACVRVCMRAYVEGGRRLLTYAHARLHFALRLSSPRTPLSVNVFKQMKAHPFLVLFSMYSRKLREL